jgi:hypothetical protein
MGAFPPPLLHQALPLVVALLALSTDAPIARAAEPFVSNPIGEAFSLVFDAEWVSLDIVDDSVEVRGTFVVLCREPVEESIPLFFPFALDSLMGEARMVSLRFRAGSDSSVAGRWETLPFNPGVRWWMPPCPGDSIVVDFAYRQEIHEDYARYIVTSARLWGRPLRYARFEIRLPPGAEPLEFSHPFERFGEGKEAYYAWETEAFFPDREIAVRWRR